MGVDKVKGGFTVRKYGTGKRVKTRSGKARVFKTKRAAQLAGNKPGLRKRKG